MTPPPSLPPTGEGLPEEIVKAIEALSRAEQVDGSAFLLGVAEMGEATREANAARSTLDATILHHLSAALAERDQALVDLSVAQGPDPEQTFDEIGMASRQTTLGKHKAANYAHIRKVIGDLDAAGMTEAADTLLWAHWWRQNERSWTKYMRESCLSQQRAAESERDAALARAERAEKENQQLREALVSFPTMTFSIAEARLHRYHELADYGEALLRWLSQHKATRDAALSSVAEEA